MNKLYDVTIVKIVDGDTVDVDIDLGFNVCLKKERIRIKGIDSPESRTSDSIEKQFGILTKNKVTDILSNNKDSVKLLVSNTDKHSEVRDKFGRILGDFIINDGSKLSEILINEGYCVPYNGQNKDEIKEQHLLNRQKLIDTGIINLNDI